MIVNKQLVDTGVQVGKAFTGKHQGYVHIADGTYWEAMYVADTDEKRVQDAITLPYHRTLAQMYQQPIRWVRRHDMTHPFVPTEIKDGK